MLRMVAVALVLVVTASGLSACNTIEGIGQDINAGGRAIQGAAQKGRS